MYLAFISGYQSIMMAPTEILVNQHAKNFEQIAKKLNITYAVLTSSTPKSQRDIILEGVKNGTIKCLFGTQSLFSDEIKYKAVQLLRGISSELSYENIIEKFKAIGADIVRITEE